MAKKTKESTPGLFDKPKTAQELKLEGVQGLYNFLFEACNIIRGPVSQDNFKDYITPILYYKRISDVYDEETRDALQESRVSGGNLIWTLLGAKTIEIIHNNIDTIDIGTPLDDLVVDADIIDSVLEDEKKREKKIVEVEKMLKIRLGEHKGDPKFKKFADKLEELRERMEQNLISSIDFLKQLLQMARELLEAEKEIEKPMDKRAQARAALTDLFQSIKTEDTPFIVEQVVNDIDNEVVNIIRQFNDAFQSVTARREIKKKLRSILWIKYQIKDNDVFEKAYSYIEMYY